MSESLTAARPYAKALYDIASQDGIQSWVPHLKVCELLGQHEESKQFLNRHDLTPEKFQSFFSALSQSANVNDKPAKFNDFIGVIAENKRFPLLPDIARLFIDKVNQSSNVVVAEITSAKPLSDASKKILLDKLAKKHGQNIETSVTIDESLIGGVVIRIGDTVIDGSVKGRLEKLAKALN